MIGVLSVAACASSSVQKVGTSSYAPLPDSADVVVFTAENQVKQPFEVVGVISHNDPGKYHIRTLADAIPELKAQAREVGANAIIIDKSEPVKSGLISTGIYVEARAIRMKVKS
jgi:predicted alpha/beta hydrolase family esterase